MQRSPPQPGIDNQRSTRGPCGGSLICFPLLRNLWFLIRYCGRRRPALRPMSSRKAKIRMFSTGFRSKGIKPPVD